MNKATEFKDVIKWVERIYKKLTLRLGQEFSAYASALNRDMKRIDVAIEALLEVNMVLPQSVLVLTQMKSIVKK